jgi:hypothetical protein
VARWLEVDGWRFLVVERFDRLGASGRRGVLSLLALAKKHLGHLDSWTAAAAPLQRAPFHLPAADAAALRWLDAFGQLIGNTDRHFGNVAFLVDGGRLRLAPAYDMLPMTLALSAEGGAAPRGLRVEPPTGANLDVWPDAAAHATRFWSRVRDAAELEEDLRAFAADAISRIASVKERLAT